MPNGNVAFREGKFCYIKQKKKKNRWPNIQYQDMYNKMYLRFV